MTAHDRLARLLADERAGVGTGPVPIGLDMADALLAEFAQVRQGVQIPPPNTDDVTPNVTHPALVVRPEGSTERTP